MKFPFLLVQISMYRQGFFTMPEVLHHLNQYYAFQLTNSFFCQVRAQHWYRIFSQECNMQALMQLLGQTVTLVPEPKGNCTGSCFTYTLGKQDTHSTLETWCISAEWVSGGWLHLLGFSEGPSTSGCLKSPFIFLPSLSRPYPGWKQLSTAFLSLLMLRKTIYIPRGIWHIYQETFALSMIWTLANLPESLKIRNRTELPLHIPEGLPQPYTGTEHDLVNVSGSPKPHLYSTWMMDHQHPGASIACFSKLQRSPPRRFL